MAKPVKKVVKKKKTVKKAALTGAKFISIRPERVETAILTLAQFSKTPGRNRRLRRAASKLEMLLRENHEMTRQVVSKLAKLTHSKQATISTIARMFAAPFAFTTLKGKLREFNKGKITFEQVMESVEKAYERRVPHDTIHNVLHCKPGMFYERIMKVALQYGSPKSLITNLTIKRMHEMGASKEEITAAHELKWAIHQYGHHMYDAMRKGNKEAERLNRKKMRELQSKFINQFTKKL